MTAVRDEDARSGAPPCCAGERPGVAGSDVPLLRDEERAAETDAGAEREQWIEEARILGAARPLDAVRRERAEERGVRREDGAAVRAQRRSSRPCSPTPADAGRSRSEPLLALERRSRRSTRPRTETSVAETFSTRTRSCLPFGRHRDDAKQERVAARGLESCAHHPGSGILRLATGVRLARALDEIEIARARHGRSLIGDVEREAEVLHGIAQRGVELLRARAQRAVGGHGFVQCRLAGARRRRA